MFHLHRFEAQLDFGLYSQCPVQHDLDENPIAGIDLGIDNLIKLISNQLRFTPVVDNGGGLNSINQYDKKRPVNLQTQAGNRRTKRLRRLTENRNCQIKHLLHIARRKVVGHLVMCGIGTLVIGYNAKWKQRVNIGRVNNQKNVSMSHVMLVEMLTHKAELDGIRVILQEESITPKCSNLDWEFPQKRDEYVGKRIKRGLFYTAEDIVINADFNGMYNIITKAFSKAIEGLEGVVVRLVSVLLSQTNKKGMIPEII